MRNSTNGSPAKLFAISMLCSLWIHLLRAWRTGQLPLLRSSTGNCCIFQHVLQVLLKKVLFGTSSQMLCISGVSWTGLETGQLRRCTKLAKSSQAKWILRNQIILCPITCQLCMISYHNHHRTGKLLLIVVCLFIRRFIRYVIITLLNLHWSLGHSIMHRFPKKYDLWHPNNNA